MKVFDNNVFFELKDNQVFVAGILISMFLLSSLFSVGSERNTAFTEDPDVLHGERYDIEITNVVDGDTVDVRFRNGSTDRVRLLGMDTPETFDFVENDPKDFVGVPNNETGIECLEKWGEKSTSRMEELIQNKNVSLKIDEKSNKRGYYDRLLGYIYVENTNTNKLLVEEGYARVYESDFSMKNEFYDAQESAFSEGIGVWNCTI